MVWCGSAQCELPQQALLPVQVSGSVLQALHGARPSELVVIAVNTSEQQPFVIPAQFSQLTADGIAYTKALSSLEPAGDPELLDQHDLLSFMFEDAGDTPCADKINWHSPVVQLLIKPAAIKQDVHQQVELKPEYVCVAYKPISESITTKLQQNYNQKLQQSDGPKGDYVHFDQIAGRATSSKYQLSMSADNPLIWHDFFYDGVNLKQGQVFGPSLLDSLKINIDAGLFLHKTRIQLNNDHLKSEIMAVEQGPIYDTIFAETRVMLAGASVLRMQVVVSFYPSHVEMTTRFKVPTIAKPIVKSPKVDVSLDANNIWGGLVLASWGNATPLVVDGVIDAVEQSLREQEVITQDAWVWYSSQRGFDLVTFLEFDDAFNVPIALVYDDDKTAQIKPERFAGQGPNVGYSIRGMIMGDYFTFKTRLLFRPTIESEQVFKVVPALQRPWRVHVVPAMVKEKPS